MEVLQTLETQILAGIQSLYDAWGWFGVVALLVFENATGTTPSEIILGFAGWMLIYEPLNSRPRWIFPGGDSTRPSAV